jgi:lipopolysaccharide export system protein LptA
MTVNRLYRRLLLAAAAAVLLAAGGSAQAQQKGQSKDTGVPNALQGFATNKDQPVQIEAASLEVRDKDKMAVFIGNVVVTQGDTVMKCKELRVFYAAQDSKDGAKEGAKPNAATSSTMKAAKPGPGGRQGISRLEALGGVVVTTKDQTATGAKGVFEMKTNTITLSGGVVIAQGKNVLRGERLVVDLATSFAKVEAGSGRVQGIFSTNSDDKPGGKDEKSGQDQKPSAKKKPTALPGPAVTN